MLTLALPAQFHFRNRHGYRQCCGAGPLFTGSGFFWPAPVPERAPIKKGDFQLFLYCIVFFSVSNPDPDPGGEKL